MCILVHISGAGGPMHACNPGPKFSYYYGVNIQKKSAIHAYYINFMHTNNIELTDLMISFNASLRAASNQ